MNKKISKIRTDNNVFVSKYIINLINKIKLNGVDLYQYSNNFNENKLNTYYDVDYINFGVDGIIRDLFFIFRKKKKIYYEEPNYMMVQKYADTFKFKKTSFEECKIAYISYPNGATLKNPNFKLKRYKDKIIILDLSYYIYQCRSYEKFMKKVEEFKKLGYYVLYGPSKILGLPGLRVGFCKCRNPKIFNIIHQPWQITSTSKLILDNLWKPDVINRHIKIIKNSKTKFEKQFRDKLAFRTDLPCLALKKPINLKTRKYDNYYRFSVVDYDLLN